ncbi:beta-ketoacyl-[acyl-carrier-protein] synthase family protein [Owenweeksia hongkongensis]|uniref:beta-ketoacyl-[acyl-carrier-protein] synthase family protein n=1 Tax=Owenweeksia hongkongensis TaxID=253245 RepID=UPI003A946CB2
MSDIVVTGIGVITALGDSAQANRSALIAGKSGLSHLENFETVYAKTRYYGEIKHSDDWLKNQLNAKEASVTRTSLLSLHAFNEAVADSNLLPENLQSQRTALVSANTVGGMCYTDSMYQDANSKEGASAYISTYDAGSSTMYLQERFGMKGHVNTINTACSSSANSIMYGARLIENGLADRVIVGGVDSLAKFTINGFNALFILSPELCRPFDKGRKGLNLGEGAAYLVLEKAENAGDKKVYARLSGYGNSNDAFHASSLSEEGVGPYKSMELALRKANLKPEQISYINAHGTATENNDSTESNAMKRLFKNVPTFSSTKAFTGHTLGAAGAVEAVYSILAIANQEVYPNLNFEESIPECGLVPQRKYEQQEVKHVMSNSFGFGGNCSSLIFSAV